MTPAAKSDDPLFQTVEEICDYAKKDGFVIFYGLAQMSEEHTVYWNEEHGGDWKKFLQSAKALGAKLLYLSWTPFEEFQLDQAVEEGSAEAPDYPESERAAMEEYKREVEKYRDKVGFTAIIDLAFLQNGIFHIYQSTAEWFRAFEELTAEEEEEPEEHEPGEEQVDKALVNKWATALANHPKFGSCKNDDQREYLLESLAGEEYETLPLGDILRRAETLYLFEVRPREEDRFRDEVRKLRNQGLNMNAIAQKLGISRDRVSGLLAD